MRLHLTVAGILIALAGCSGPQAPAERTPEPAAPPAQQPAPPARPAATRPPLPIPAAVTVPAFSDPLLPGAGRAEGTALAGLALATGGAAWSANDGIVLAADGATARTVGGAHHRIPVIAGQIRLSAEVRAEGSGFTGIALGHDDLSGSFWANNDLLLMVRAGGYALMAGKLNLLPKADPGLLHPGASDRLELAVDTIARTVTARINGRTVLDGARLPEAVKVDRLSAAGFRCNEPVTAGMPRVAAWRCEALSAATTGLVPADLAMCFVEPGRPATLRFTAAARGPDTRVPYVISDYAGTRVEAADATLAADGSVSIEHRFARGWYEVAFPAAHQAFGVVALEPAQGPADPFFCIDSGLTWLETDPARRDALVRILARSGIAMSRERMGLGLVNPDAGTYRWDEGKRAAGALRTAYAAHGVPLLEMLHGGAKHVGMIKDSPYPQGLPALATGWSAIATHWQGGWGGAEVENEPDLHGVPADQYAPLAKVTSYALARSSCRAPLVTGVFASIPPGPFFDTCAANGLLDDSDAISFHSYDRAPAVEAMVARYRAWLASAGAEAMPLWHSECGWPWVNGPARPPRDQDADSACEIAMKAVESLACGVARHFPFVYVYYEEGQKNFGMMGREATPLRSMAAYAMAAHTLAGRRYLGDLRGVGAPAVLARVFAGGDGEAVAVIYSGKPAAGVRLPLAAKRAAGADGRELALADGMLPLDDGLAYVWFDAAAVAPAVDADTGAARLYAIGQRPAAARPRLASPIVLQFAAQKTPSRASARRYLVTQEQAHALPLTVRIHNLSDRPVAVRPALTLPGGAANPAAALTVPAQGTAEAAWTVDATPALDIARTRLVTVTAEADGVAQPSPLAIPLIMDGSLEQHLAKHPRQAPLPIAELGRWHANIAGHGSSRFAMDEGVWRMSCSFTGNGGNWVYPKFDLAARLDPATDSGFLIRARILKPAGTVAVMADPNTPGSFWCPDLFPADGAWHVVYVPFAEFKPGPNGAGMQNSRLDIASWKVIAIGMGSAVPENALEISHFLVVGGGE